MNSAILSILPSNPTVEDVEVASRALETCSEPIIINSLLRKLVQRLAVALSDASIDSTIHIALTEAIVRFSGHIDRPTALVMLDMLSSSTSPSKHTLPVLEKLIPFVTVHDTELDGILAMLDAPESASAAVTMVVRAAPTLDGSLVPVVATHVAAYLLSAVPTGDHRAEALECLDKLAEHGGLWASSVRELRDRCG
ncbi:hypothetical protein J8273_2860 [Carpediemonas membranifera]|uniref:Uncharacterized protein n=1 Tax=Carpediemonas membranifera TaxID=201153 RepID=A0A8J6AV96_9EUKA|nr:hypothetical protein J8273_2860 [Carpediemonas membranifera]|eukprot:KAG9395656.1 hypothetical protein J8273_2860 [Carpediemonas membranifera]